MKSTLMLLGGMLALQLAGASDMLWLWPVDDLRFRWWQILTYTFCHSGWLHLSINAVALLSFGPFLARTWGAGRMWVCFALCGATGGVFHILASWSVLPAVGASGALSGLLAAYAYLRPDRRLTTVLPWDLRAWDALQLYVAFSMAMWVLGWLSGVAHLAHAGGAIAGLLFTAANDKAPE